MTNSEFLKWVLDKSIKHGITIVFSPISEDNYFEHNSQKFKNKAEININTKDGDLIGNLVHEWCHAEQWIENSPLYWNIAKYSLLDDPKNWDKFSKKELKDILAMYRDAELDCEKRAIQHIKEKELDIDLVKYIKHANALIYHYNMMLQYGWNAPSPLNFDEIIDKMPTDFNRKYIQTPTWLSQLYKKYY